jgi:hypothetical protein
MKWKMLKEKNVPVDQKTLWMTIRQGFLHHKKRDVDLECVTQHSETGRQQALLSTSEQQAAEDCTMWNQSQNCVLHQACRPLSPVQVPLSGTSGMMLHMPECPVTIKKTISEDKLRCSEKRDRPEPELSPTLAPESILTKKDFAPWWNSVSEAMSAALPLPTQIVSRVSAWNSSVRYSRYKGPNS